MAFNVLPIELNRMIALNLESDRDICTFRAVCRSTHDAVDGDGGSFWRTKFRELYAYDRKRSNKHYKKAYQRRRQYLRKGIGMTFGHGGTHNEGLVLQALRGLILDSFTGPPITEGVRRWCPNHEHLMRFALESKNFMDIRRLPANAQDQPNSPRLLALQLMFAHYLFVPDFPERTIYSFEASQKAVYESPLKEPIFQGFNKQEVNLEWTLHCLNFFRYHLKSRQAGSLYETMEELPAHQGPWMWESKIRNSNNIDDIPRFWKGTYAYLDRSEVAQLRQSTDLEDAFIDRNVEPGGIIQNLTLDTTTPAKFAWPTVFEKHLNALPKPQRARTRAQKRITARRSRSRSPQRESQPMPIRFTGEGDDEEHFFASGWVTPLPSQPREEDWEIPGWKRITFMKHFIDDEDGLDQDNLWAYEGVMLPGNKLILGRWWWCDDTPNREDVYSGPFIFWAVDNHDPPDPNEKSIWPYHKSIQ